jgi:hypothetical protein
VESRTKIVLATAVVALFGASIAFGLLNREVALSDAAVVDAQRAESERLHRPGMEDAAPISGRSPAPTAAAGTWSGHVSSVWSATQLGALRRELAALAEAGDTAAMVAILEIDLACVPFSPSTAHSALPYILAAAGLPEVEHQRRSFALGLLQRKCDLSYADGEVVEERHRWSTELEAKAQEGDVVARAFRRFEGESEQSILDAYASSTDPWVAQRALMAISDLPPGDRLNGIDRALFRNLRVLGNEAMVREVQRQAARWRACDLGAPCGSDQIPELYACINQGNCGLGLDVRTYIRQRSLSGFQLELMQRYLTELDKEVPRR